MPKKVELESNELALELTSSFEKKEEMENPCFPSDKLEIC
jgi:hypothetical protein